jgi:hypothetical protein
MKTTSEKINVSNLLNYSTEITEKQYNEQFECLPPIFVKSINDIITINGFIVSEPYNHNEMGLPVFCLYFKRFNELNEYKYYCFKKYVYLKHEDKPVIWYNDFEWSICHAYTN